MSGRLRVSILVIGDEILGGFVQDTNSGWLAGRLHTLGVPLDRITTIPDEAEDIAGALHAELARSRPRVILTSGGIGSTPDDLTFAAVAAALGRGLVLHPEIEARVARALDWTVDQGIPVSQAHAASMWKMARVPEGAYLLGGARGVVPGVALDFDGGSAAPGGATLVILPGVPGELRRITLSSVEPLLLAGRGIPQHVEELTHRYPESTLNPVLDRLVAEFPDLHVGSYPGRDCIVRLKGPREQVLTAMSLVEDFVADLDRQPSTRALRERWQSGWRD
jgi:molybdenum cofactor synthesis domain-containing protein